MRRGKLFLDLGAHVGNDTAYYLEKGWQVVAVEAHPELAKQADARFHLQRLDCRVIHKAITENGEAGKLYTSDKGTKGETHSIYPHRTKRAISTPFHVQGTTVGRLLTSYGVPDYMKVDIEGADVVAIRQLHEWCRRKGEPFSVGPYKMAHNVPPAYLSVELCPEHPEEALEIFSHLAYMGYDLFSIEEQHWDVTVDVDAVEHRLPINAMAGLWFIHMAGNRDKDVWYDLHARHSSVEDTSDAAP